MFTKFKEELMVEDLEGEEPAGLGWAWQQEFMELPMRFREFLVSMSLHIPFCSPHPRVCAPPSSDPWTNPLFTRDLILPWLVWLRGSSACL